MTVRSCHLEGDVLQLRPAVVGVDLDAAVRGDVVEDVALLVLVAALGVQAAAEQWQRAPVLRARHVRLVVAAHVVRVAVLRM